MESNPVVFDISSDEDDVASAFEEVKGDDYGWFSEVLEAVNKGFDDSDEVVVVSEVNPTKKSKPSVKKNVVEDDDDCIVLEGDPEKAVSEVTDHHDDSDELIFVSQKGQRPFRPAKAPLLWEHQYVDCCAISVNLGGKQVACRDFPHTRHDCAKFPFSSTSHEQHCELCHCFVCDMRAPCSYWGSGISNADHCHATDKEEVWKTMRKNFRFGRNVSVPPATSHSTVVPQLNKVPRPNIIRLTTQNLVPRPTPSVTSHSTVMPQPNQAPRRDIVRLTTQTHVSRPTSVQAAGNCIQQNHILRPSMIRACSSSTGYGIPYNPIVGSRHVNKIAIQPRSVSQEVLGVRDTVVLRDRGIKISNLGSQFVSSNTMSKRLDTEVPLTMNHTAYVPLENITSTHASHYQQNLASVTTSNERNPSPIGQPTNCSSTSLRTYTDQSFSQPSMDTVFLNSASSLPSADSQCFPQLNVHVDVNPVENQNHHATSDGISDFDNNWVDNIGENIKQPSADCLQFQTSGTTTEEGPFKDLENFLFDNQCAPEGPLTAVLNVPSPPDRISFDTGMLYFDIESSWDHLRHA